MNRSHPRIREWLTAGRDALRDWVERSPLERAVLGVMDRFSPPGAAVFQERRDIDLMRELLQRELTETSNAMDIGANIGRVTRMMTRLAPRGKHIAVEPSPRLAKRLRRLPGVEVVEAAVGERSGEATFYEQIANHPQSSLVPAEGNDVRQRRVAVVTIDQLVGGRAIDLIKIDVEGVEYAALTGAAETIARCVPTIIFEFTSRASGATPAQMHDLLTQRYGLTVRALGEDESLDAAAFEAAVREKRWINFVARAPVGRSSPTRK